MLHDLAGKIAPRYILCNIPELVSFYYVNKPSTDNVSEKISFGTSGHRGSSLNFSFNEDHILSVTQAICNYRKENGINGPLFIGKDTHALSEPAYMTAIEVLVANGVDIMVSTGTKYTPTPVISNAIITYNKNNNKIADGIVITPSHNPPQDGGFKYNPPSGGPADTNITSVLEKDANKILSNGLKGVKRVPYYKARKSDFIHNHNYLEHYTSNLKNVIDLDLISRSKVKIAADALGGSGIDYYGYIAEKYKLDLTVYHDYVDPSFSFMTVDWDGKIRMDCSSGYAMASLIALKDKYDIAFGNDPDFDRHGIVTKSGLMNPNYYLSVAIWYLFTHRHNWGGDLKVGKTLVSSSMIDKVASFINREVYEVPVGFKWFVDGLLSGKLGFGGEESAGASFLAMDGSAWSTDKDGIIMSLLAAEILAKTGKGPDEHYEEFENRFGASFYTRVDVEASLEVRNRIKNLTADKIPFDNIGGEEVIEILTHAKGNGAPIGGIKIVTNNGWLAVRPSGTEDIYKIYAESFISTEHLNRLISEIKIFIKSFTM